MAFDDTYRESIQSKHLSNVGFSSTAKGVTNETYALKNPHQILATQVPVVDVVGTYGALVASGIAAGMVEKHSCIFVKGHIGSVKREQSPINKTCKGYI